MSTRHLPTRALATRPLLAALGAGLVLTLPGGAAAETREDRGEPRPPAWLGLHMHYQKGAGFEYRRAFKLGDTPLELGLQGPVVRKKKRLGLMIVVRF